MNAAERIARARQYQELSTFGGDSSKLPAAMAELDAVEAEALFWIGCCLQVVRADEPMSVPYFERSRELAAQADDKLTMSYAIRHLAYVEQSAGRLDAARELICESIRLRREVGFLPGVAANLIVLAEIVAGQEGKAAGLALLDEAEAVAAAKDCEASQVGRLLADRTGSAPRVLSARQRRPTMLLVHVPKRTTLVSRIRDRAWSSSGRPSFTVTALVLAARNERLSWHATGRPG